MSVYEKYLVMLLAVVLGAALVSAFLLAGKRRNNKPGAKEKVRPVDCGNISVFSDSFGNITVIPYVSDLFGAGKATAGITVLKQPYQPGKLGEIIRSSLASCSKAEPIGSPQLMKILQERDWKEFAQGKKNLSVYYQKGLGIVFNTTIQASEGAFVFRKRGAESSLPPDADNETIGRLSLELLKRCR